MQNYILHLTVPGPAKTVMYTSAQGAHNHTVYNFIPFHTRLLWRMMVSLGEPGARWNSGFQRNEHWGLFRSRQSDTSSVDTDNQIINTRRFAPIRANRHLDRLFSKKSQTAKLLTQLKRLRLCQRSDSMGWNAEYWLGWQMYYGMTQGFSEIFPCQVIVPAY